MGNLRLVVPHGWDRVMCYPYDSDGDPVHVYNDGIGKKIEKIITTYDKPFENLFRHLPNNLQRISMNCLNFGFPNNEEAIVKLAMLHDLCSLDDLNSNYSDSKFGVTHRVLDSSMTSYMHGMNNMIIVSGCPRRNRNIIEALEGLYDYDVVNNLPHDTTIYCLFDDTEKSLLNIHPNYKVRYFMAVTRGVSEFEFISFFHNSFEVLPYSYESPLLKKSEATPCDKKNYESGGAQTNLGSEDTKPHPKKKTKSGGFRMKFDSEEITNHTERKTQTKKFYEKPKLMSFDESIKTCLIKKYADLKGRASRSEYWWFVLGYFMVDSILI